MVKYYDSSWSYKNNDSQITFYIEIAKPLILSLPDVNDKVKALAWLRKIIDDNSNLGVRIECLQLLLKFLRHRKLSGPFAGLPDIRRPLKEFNGQMIQNLSRFENKRKYLTERNSIKKYHENDFPDNYRIGMLRSNYTKIVREAYDTENNTQRIRKNKRVSAGYSTYTEKDIKLQIENIMSSPGEDNEKIKKCKNMLLLNYLPPTTLNENELKQFGFEKPLRSKRKITYDEFDVARVYEKLNNTIKSDNIQGSKCKHKNSVEKNMSEHAHKNKNKTVRNMPRNIKINEENDQYKMLQKSSELRKIGELESFLLGSKKYFTISVSKECLMNRTIFKCIKYVINNSQCSYYKFKDYLFLTKSIDKMTPESTRISKKRRHGIDATNKNRYENKQLVSYDPTINQSSFFGTNSILTNLTFANIRETLQNIVQDSIYIQMSLILATGAIFFWKLFQIIFMCQMQKKNDYPAQLVSQIYKIRPEEVSPHVLEFVVCFILYQLVNDIINIFY